MPRINGNDFVITAATSAAGTQEMFLHATSGTWDWTDAVIETTSKDSNSKAEFISGRQTGTIAIDGLIDYSTATANTMNTVDIFDRYYDGDIFHCVISGDDTTGTGRVTYSAQVLLTSLSQTGGSDEVATYSLSGQITGEVTKTVMT